MAYDLRDLIKAAADPGKVSVSYDAKKGAEFFNIFSDTELLYFINNGLLDEAKYINTEVWHLNPNKPPDINVDAYSFYSGDKYGYIAFMFISKTNKWRIKSFKHNTDPDPRCVTAGLSYLPFDKLKDIIQETD